MSRCAQLFWRCASPGYCWSPSLLSLIDPNPFGQGSLAETLHVLDVFISLHHLSSNDETTSSTKLLVWDNGWISFARNADPQLADQFIPKFVLRLPAPRMQRCFFARHASAISIIQAVGRVLHLCIKLLRNRLLRPDALEPKWALHTETGALA